VWYRYNKGYSCRVHIAIPISLRDRFDAATSPSAAELANFNFIAHGDIRVTNSLQLPHFIQSEINANAVPCPFLLPATGISSSRRT